MALAFAKHPVFIILTYVVILLPLAIYDRQDVTDSRWRNRDRQIRRYRFYMCVNGLAVVYSVVIFIANFAGEEDPDYHEVGTLLLALVANGFMLWKLLRGIAITHMLHNLARMLRLRGDDGPGKLEDHKFEGYVGDLANKLSSNFMDDDIQGDGPRIRWLGLLILKPLRWWREHTIHTFDAIPDLTDYVLVVAWAWRCLGQVDAHRNEYEHLWWLVRGLDHATVVGLMHARGEEFVQLDEELKKNKEKIEVTDTMQHPYYSRVHHDSKGGWLLDYIGWFEAGAVASYSPKDAAKQELMSKKDSTLTNHPEGAHGLRSLEENHYVNTIRVTRLWLATLGEKAPEECLPVMVDVGDIGLDEMQDLKACTEASANSLLVHCALKALSMGSRRLQQSKEELQAFVKGVLLRVCVLYKTDADTDAESPQALCKERGDRYRGIYPSKFARTPDWLRKCEGIKVDIDESKVDIDESKVKEHVPPFLVAYATSIMPLFLHAGMTDEPQQEAAIGAMPATDYHTVSAPRLAFIGIASLHRQLARLVKTDAGSNSPADTQPLPSGSNGESTLRDTGRHVTVAIRPTDTQNATEELSPMTAKEWSVLLKSCCGLLQVADRLMLHSEDMFGEKPMTTWDRKHAYLWTDCRMHITMMMAITFASVVCCGCVMDKHSSAAHDAQAETSMRNDLLVMAALHHAVSTGWEFMLWQICGPLSMDDREKSMKDLDERYGLASAMVDWGIQLLPSEDESINPFSSPSQQQPPREESHVEALLLAPAAAAKLMSNRYPSSGENPSVDLRYEISGLKVGKSLLSSFRSLKSNILNGCEGKDFFQ